MSTPNPTGDCHDEHSGPSAASRPPPADTIRTLDIDETALVSGAVVIDLHAPDPANPLCPEPRPGFVDRKK